MKTLKKVLSLVLALAMVLGMVVTASAATPSYTDAKSITYTEAVKVMSLAGVLEGYTDGSFKPAGTLTRAEATKMIVYMLGLEETSLGYKANFGDINGHWAETPISVAAGLGIVAGIGNGKFDPNGTLTGFQWAKILLCAMGYDAEIEGMLGAGWEAKVAKVAKAEGLVKGITGFDGSKPVEREVAAKMAFNVIDNGFVGYPETGKAAVVLGSEYYTQTATYGKADNFALRLGIKVTYPDNDTFKRPVKKYTVAKESVEFLVDADAVYTVATPEEDIFDDLELADVLAAKEADDKKPAPPAPKDKEEKVEFVTYVNGTEAKGEKKLVIADKEDNEEYTAQGRLVAFYNIENKKGEVVERRAVVIDTYLAKVEKVTEAKLKDNGDVKTKAAITLSVKSSNYKTVILKADENYDYAKGDYVLVYVKDSNNGEIVGLAESKAQKLNAYVFADPAVKLDGEEEALAYKLYIDYIDLTNLDFSVFIKLAKTLLNKAYLGTTVTAYYDQYGNVIGLFAGVTDTDYYVVDCIWMDGGKRPDLKADIVDLEGNKTEEVSISLDRLENTFDFASELVDVVIDSAIAMLKNGPFPSEESTVDIDESAAGLLKNKRTSVVTTVIIAAMLKEMGTIPTIDTSAMSGDLLGLVTFSENADGQMVFEFNEELITILAEALISGIKLVDGDDGPEIIFDDTAALEAFGYLWVTADCPWLFGDVKMATGTELKEMLSKDLHAGMKSIIELLSSGTFFEAGDDEVYGLDGTRFGLDVTDETVFLFKEGDFGYKTDAEYTVYTADTCPSFTANPWNVWYVEEGGDLKIVYVNNGDTYENRVQIALDLNGLGNIKELGDGYFTLSAVTADRREDEITIKDPASLVKTLLAGDSYIFNAYVDEEGVYEIVGVAPHQSEVSSSAITYRNSNQFSIGNYITCKKNNVEIYVLNEDYEWVDVDDKKDEYFAAIIDPEVDFYFGFILDGDYEKIEAIFIEEPIVSAYLVNAEASGASVYSTRTVDDEGVLEIAFAQNSFRLSTEPTEELEVRVEGPAEEKAKDEPEKITFTLTSAAGETLVIEEGPEGFKIKGSDDKDQTFLGYDVKSIFVDCFPVPYELRTKKDSIDDFAEDANLVDATKGLCYLDIFFGPM